MPVKKKPYDYRKGFTPREKRGERVYLDHFEMVLICNDKSSLPLTLREFQILSVLLNATDCLVTRNQFHSSVWRGIKTTQHTLDVHIFHLRKKIAKVDAIIEYKAPDSFALKLPLP